MTPQEERRERMAFDAFILIARGDCDHDECVDWYVRLWYRCTEEMREYMRERADYAISR